MFSGRFFFARGYKFRLINQVGQRVQAEKSRVAQEFHEQKFFYFIDLKSLSPNRVPERVLREFFVNLVIVIAKVPLGETCVDEEREQHLPKTFTNHQPAHPTFNSSTVDPSFIDTSELPIAQ